MKALGYIRVSTEGQAREGVSLAAQRERIGRYCAGAGLKLAVVVEDAGASGAGGRSRAGWVELLDRVEAGEAGAGLSNLFAFCREAFGDESQEMLILVTELTASPSAARFIGRWGSPEYFEHNRELLFYERRQDIAGDIDRLEGKTQS